MNRSRRFGFQLNGLPNINYLFGAPTGGSEDYQLNPKYFDEMKLGGSRRKHKAKNRRCIYGGANMYSYINPYTYGYTFPNIGTRIY